MAIRLEIPYFELLRPWPHLPLVVFPTLQRWRKWTRGRTNWHTSAAARGNQIKPAWNSMFIGFEDARSQIVWLERPAVFRIDHIMCGSAVNIAWSFFKSQVNSDGGSTHQFRSSIQCKDNWGITKNFEAFWSILMHFEAFWSILKHFEAFWSILKHLEAFWSILKYFEAFWSILKHFEAFRSILKHFEASWSILKHFEVFWSILKHFEASWSILKYFEAFWSILKHFEASWSILKHFEAFWSILKHLEAFWSILKYFEAFWSILKHFEAFWSILKHFEASWSILKHFEVFWSILKHLEAFWSILKYFEAFWSILKHFEAFWSILKHALCTARSLWSHKVTIKAWTVSAFCQRWSLHLRSFTALTAAKTPTPTSHALQDDPQWNALAIWSLPLGMIRSMLQRCIITVFSTSSIIRRISMDIIPK